jgi:LacI family transcriptional regulator, galactose operon repressor
MAATMKSIARDLGVSTITISRVFHNRTDISPETRKRVLQRLKEVKYRPNPAARALSTGRMHLIGLIVPDLVHPFFAEIAKVVSAQLSSKGYGLVVFSSEDDPKIERDRVRQAMALGVDALVLASVESESRALRPYLERRNPLLLLDRRLPDLGSRFVGIDDVRAGVIATRHLYDRGCRTIAHLAGPPVSTARDRETGYKQALMDAHLVPKAAYIISCDSPGGAPEKAGFRAMQKLLALVPRPDGVFCFNDPIAIGAMRAIEECELRIPGDVAVVGCGNLRFNDDLHVPLTSVDQDVVCLGRNVAELLLSAIEGEDRTQGADVVVPAHLVVRASTSGERGFTPGK